MPCLCSAIEITEYFKMRNWLVLGRRCKLRTNASWPPTVRGWTACTPVCTIHPQPCRRLQWLCPVRFLQTSLLFSSMKKCPIHDAVFIPFCHHVFIINSSVINIHDFSPTLFCIIYFTKWQRMAVYTVDFGTCVVSSRWSSDNSGTFYSNLWSMCGRSSRC